MRALIIDDSSAVCLLLTKLLRSLIPGIDVHTVKRGRSALYLIESGQSFDFIILDLGHPDIGGLQVLEALLAINKRQVVFTISDESSQDMLRESTKIGATGYLTKPISRAQLCDAFNLKVKAKPVVSAKPKVLVVDDEKMNRFLAGKIMEKGGYQVAEATNGFEAIRAVDRDCYDCILMDIRMPFMNGIEASRQIRRDYPYLPILAATAEPLDMIAEEGKRAGIDQMINKPIQKESLLQMVDQLIKKKKAELEEVSSITEVDKEELTPPLPLETEAIKLVPSILLENQKSENPISRGLMHHDNMTLMVIEITNLKEICDELSPEDSFKFLNSFVEVITPVVDAFDGYVYQISGSKITCLFKLTGRGYSNNAVHASLSIQDQLIIYNKGRARAQYKETVCSCVLVSGPMALGIIGSNQAYNLGALGEPNDIAMAMSDYLQGMDVDIAMSESVLDLIEDPEALLIRPLGKHDISNEYPKSLIFEIYSHNTSTERELKHRAQMHLEKVKYVPDDFSDLFPSDGVWEKLRIKSFVRIVEKFMHSHA